MNTLKTLLSAILLTSVLAACGSRITAENFEKIEDGMSHEQVIAILGEPPNANTNGLPLTSSGSAEWTDGNQTITIRFFNGKVKLKRFSSHQ